MKRNFKRVISMLLCAAMVVGFLPAMAHVAHATTEPGKFNPVLIHEDFETANDTGIPAGWVSFSQHGAVDKATGTGFVADGDENYYQIAYNAAADSAHIKGWHHGIGKAISLADNGGHAQIRLTAKLWGASNAILITRFNKVVDGAPDPYNDYKGNNTVACAVTTKPAADNLTYTYNVSDFEDGLDYQLVLLEYGGREVALNLDDVKLEYVHTYNLSRDSGVAASSTTNYIKCDHCDALKKDDPTATGVNFVYTNGILVDEDFSTQDSNGIPEGWMPATDSVSSTPNTTNANIGYVDGTYKISGNRTGIAIPISLGNSNGHTKVRYSAQYSGDGLMISRVYTGTGSAFIGADSYNVTSNINTNVAGDGGNRTYEWTIVDENGEYLYGTNLQVRFVGYNAESLLYLDNVNIEYVHTYTQNRDSGVAANAYSNYICCDHCKALKKDDPAATGSLTVISDPSTLVYEDFEIVDPQDIPEGWMSATESASSTPNTTNANIGYVGDGTYKVSNATTGFAVPFSIANSNGHTAVRYSVLYTGEGLMRTSVYAGTGNTRIGSIINQGVTQDGGNRSSEWTIVDENGEYLYGTDLQLRLVGHSATSLLYVDSIHIEYIHSYTQNRDSGIAANAYSNYIKCDHCDKLKKDDAQATGSNVIYTDNNVLFHDDFSAADATGIPGGVLFANAGVSTYGTESPAADFGYVDGAYKITGNRTGIAIPVSVANSNGHAQIIVTAKYSGSGLMISRVSAAGPNAFITGANTNNTASSDGGVRTHTVNLADASGAASLYVIFVPNAAGYDILLDEVHVAYVHSYTQNRDSGVAANAHSNWICCDHCDMLKKDDATASGSLTVLASSSILVYEDFETVDPQGIPEGWMSALDTSSSAANVPSAYVGYVVGDSNNTYKISGKVSNARTGIAIPISVANNNGHTKVRYSAAYSGEGSMISRVYTGTGGTYIMKDDYNATSNINQAVTADNGLRTYEWTILDAEGNYPYGTDLQLRFLPLNGSAEFELDNVLVEYVHTYNENLPGKEASAGVYYIKCDHCDALKANDPHATGDIYVDNAGNTYACNISKVNINMGENLAIKFAFKKADLASVDGYKAVINIAGKNAVEIPSTSWMSQTISGEAYWIVAATGLAAKEMNASVEVYVKDAEGNKVSTTKTTSLREYAESKLQNSENAEFKTVVVDMLNYGAAAQNHFKHDTENLANRNLTPEQQALATPSVSLGTVTAEATGVSKTVSFESDIVLKFKPADTTATIAVITYKPHSASENVTKTVNSNGGVFSLVGLVVADYETEVTATFYAGSVDSDPVATVTYSLKQYVTNKNETGSETMKPLAIAFAKFSTSAYNYLH